MLRIAPEPALHLGAGTFQITQFVNLPRLNHPALIRLAIVPFRVDPVEIPIILGINLPMDRENTIFNAFYGFFSVTHIIRSFRYLKCRFLGIKISLWAGFSKYSRQCRFGNKNTPICAQQASSELSGNKDAPICSRYTLPGRKRTCPFFFLAEEPGRPIN